MNAKKVKTSSLAFDRKNPRLADSGDLIGKSEHDILNLLWETMDVRELVQSIAASGYFEHEPLIVSEEDGQQVVIEGNRRLAAVQALLDPSKVENPGWEIPRLGRAAKSALNDLPIITSTRENAWRYLGFKHVNGPAKWSSYAKATYIAEVHKNYGVSLDDIAKQIGDRHQTVRRLYRGLMVLEQAERLNVYNREDRYRPRLAFSHLYTGLDGTGFSDFLGLSSTPAESTSPVPESKSEQLGEVCLWLYGSKKRNRPPIVQKQSEDLWRLSKVLEDREATATLRQSQDLDAAYERTRPSSSVFEESLIAAKTHLMRARANLTTGYSAPNLPLLRIAGEVWELAVDIHDEMERKAGVRKRRPSG